MKKIVCGIEATDAGSARFQSIQLPQNPQARMERIAVRRARIRAKIASTRKGTGSDDGDIPDMDASVSNVHHHKSHRHSHATHHGHSHHHHHAHGKSHHGHHERHSRVSSVAIDHETRPSIVIDSMTTPGKKPVVQKPIEIDPILSIDEKMVNHVEKSKKELEQLLLDAETFVTNVKVAAEFRELTRHNRQEESKKLRLEKLEKEDQECEDLFKTVSENWFQSAKGLLPLELYQKIQEQQKSSEDLLEKKQDLIDSLKAEIEGNDVEYEADLQKHQKDLMLMGDRIDDQVEMLRLAFMKEMELLEEYTAKDRETLMEDNEKEWSEHLNEFDKFEAGTLDAMHAAAMERFNTLTDIYTQSREQSRRMKVQLENDMRTLQLEAEHIKIAAILNAEKLEYNLEILRRRENENLKMKSSMKRLILKLQDRFNDKAKSLQDIVKAAKKENANLIKDIYRLEFLNKDAMNKALQEVTSDYKKYMDLWEMNEDEMRDKLIRLLGAEKFIMENYLGLEIEDPDFQILDDRPDEVQQYFMKQFEITGRPGVLGSQFPEHIFPRKDVSEVRINSNNSPISEVKPEEVPPSAQVQPSSTSAYSTNSQKQVNIDENSLMVLPAPSLQFLPGPTPDPTVQRRLMKHITKVICDQTGFIIEEKLRRILGPMINTEKTLIHIDTVLQALGVTNFSEMQVLARYMLRESKVMRGVMSKMGTDVTPDVSAMGLSLTGFPVNEQDVEDFMQKLIDKVALASKPQLDVEDEMEPRNILATASSSEFSWRGKDFDEEIPKSVEKILEKIEESGIPKTADFQLGDTPKVTKVHRVQEDLSSGALTPVSEVSMPSLGKILQQFSSDNSLVNALHQVKQKKREAQEDEGEDEETLAGIDDDDDESDTSDSTCNSSSICSCESVDDLKNQEALQAKRGSSINTTGATVTSWAKRDADEVKVVFPIRTGDAESDDDEMKSQSEQVEQKDPRIDTQITSGVSGGRSLTISIPSLATTSAGSDEFLYIEPNDVLRALASFCKDYNAKIKIELPTDEELIEKKLAKLKFPSDARVIEYWNRFLILLDPKSHELWEAILKCFVYYAAALEERNKLILENEKIHRENLELGFLLKKHWKGCCPGSNSQQFDPSNTPYCDC